MACVNKTKWIQIPFMLLCILGMLSCRQMPSHIDEGDDFSVNDTILRSELVQMPMNLQRKVFLSLPPEMKYKLYEYKFSVDFKSGELSIKEKRELYALYKELMSIENFSTPGSVPEDRFLYWENRLAEKLGWDTDKIYRHTMTFMTGKEYDGYNTSCTIVE